MVFLVVSVITQQLGHSAMCASSLERNSASVRSSRKSLSSWRKSLHVSKGVVPLALEITGQFLAQLLTGPAQPAFHRRHGKAQRIGRFLSGQLVDIPEYKNRTIRRIEALHRRIQNSA